MLNLKHLKTLQHVSIIIQIIFRELTGSLLKSLNLKMQKVNCCDAAAAPSPQLKMIWMMIETCWSVFKFFKINILD